MPGSIQPSPYPSCQLTTMPALNRDIWHDISKYLLPRDLLSFMSTHSDAKNVIGPHQIQHMKYWGQIFKDFDWLPDAVAQGSKPVLIFPNKHEYDSEEACPSNEEMYICLGRTDENRTAKETSPDRVLHKRMINSLRSNTVGKQPYERVFDSFILNIGTLLYGDLPTPIGDLSWAHQGKMRLAVFQGATYKTKAEKVLGHAILAPTANCGIVFCRSPTIAHEYYLSK